MRVSNSYKEDGAICPSVITICHAIYIVVASLTYHEYLNPSREEWATALVIQLAFTALVLGQSPQPCQVIDHMFPALASAIMLVYEQDRYVVFGPSLLLASLYMNVWGFAKTFIHT